MPDCHASVQPLASGYFGYLVCLVFTGMNAMEGLKAKNKPLIVYNRRRRKFSWEVAESPVAVSSNSGPRSRSQTPLFNKAISVYRRRGGGGMPANVANAEASYKGSVNSSDSAIQMNEGANADTTNNRLENNDEEIGSGTSGTTIRRSAKRRDYESGARRDGYELRSSACRAVGSQLSSTDDEVKFEVSTISSVAEIQHKLNYKFQSPKIARKCHRKYLKYSTILKNIGNKSDTVIATRHENAADVYKEDEDYMGDERKQKVTRSVESLYICPIVIGDFCDKSWDHK